MPPANGFMTGMGMAGLVDAINSNPLLASDDEGSGKENEDIDIDLGSSYANDLGFDSTIKPFVGDDSTSPEDSTSPDGKADCGGGSAKKKKKNKKKKKK